MMAFSFACLGLLLGYSFYNQHPAEDKGKGKKKSEEKVHSQLYT